MDRGRLGRQLRRLREERSLSLAGLARATAISPSFLSLIEAGKSDIAVGRLLRLADFFEADLADLIAGGQDEAALIETFDPDAGTWVDSAGEGIELRLLGGPNWILDPAIVEFEAGGGRIDDNGGDGSSPAHEVFIHVLRGRFDVSIPGASCEQLTRGESALVRCGPRVRNIGRDVGRLLMVGIRSGRHQEPPGRSDQRQAEP